MRKSQVFPAIRAEFVGLVLLLCCSTAFGQTTFGSITGTVTDPSGAGIPGAQVTVTNETTGGLRSATTGGSGVYNVPDLNIGIYRVRVEAKGFEVFVREHLTLDARQILDIDAQLTVGAVTE